VPNRNRQGAGLDLECTNDDISCPFYQFIQVVVAVAGNINRFVNNHPDPARQKIDRFGRKDLSCPYDRNRQDRNAKIKRHFKCAHFKRAQIAVHTPCEGVRAELALLFYSTMIP
jgi:hypothetical protein